MVRVKMMGNNEVAVISNRIAYLFDIGGRFKSADPHFTPYMDGAVDLPCVSVLSSSGKVELGISCNDTFRTVPVSLDMMVIMSKLRSSTGMLRMLMKSGVQDGNISYNQMIFVFNSDTALKKALLLLGITI